MTEKTFDIGVIGGGPAGLSAAIWSARYLHSVCVIDSGDPRHWETLGVNGYLGLEADDARVGATCRQLFSSDSPTFRKGAIGQWRDQFDDELEALFARSVGDRMQTYGYEPSRKG